ncbi:UNVERIFIED_CONTAM: hypothetical protein FKN15_046605 [Acipenser sinensis]
MSLDRSAKLGACTKAAIAWWETAAQSFSICSESANRSSGEKERQRKRKKTVKTAFCMGYFPVRSPLAQSHGMRMQPPL